MSDFILSAKSTIDYHGAQAANALSKPFIDLDDQVGVSKVFETDAPAVMWQLLTLVEDPVDPLYRIVFGVGAKTSADPGNYNLLSLMDSLKTVFYAGAQLDIYDYSGAVVGTTPVGYILIGSVSLDPQEFDRQAGIRMITVSGRAVRYI